MWTKECDKAFRELKKFLSSPPVLVSPKANSYLILYLVVSKKERSLIFFKDNERDEKLVYFINKVLKGGEIRYQKIEQLALAVVVTARKLR